MQLQTIATVDEIPTPAAIQPPSRLAFQNLAETLAALADEARAITGAPEHRGQSTVIVSDVPAAMWHALPGTIAVSNGYTWKVVAHVGSAHISAFCEHNDRCPDRPTCLYCQQTGHWSQDCEATR